MTRMLESYAAGRWYAASDEGRPLLDAATGEEVARISSNGLDLREMTAYARTVGGPAIRALTFHERAGLLKALAKHLSDAETGIKDELYDLSFRTGATKRDSMVDIDGGFGTMFSFASKGVRELPNDTVVTDGNLEQLGRGGTFVGQHVYTSRPGVAVQINAFNFPVWGMLEKLAPAFLAGLPSIVKPAAQTSYLTELAVRRIVESGILPEGALQLLCGSPAGLLDELTVQDSVAFTGSAHTAGMLRTHTNVMHGGVQLGVEADSLNCSVLGPDVSVDDPEFDLFVKGVVAEMTVKAGQKCTAIRRAIVPSSSADAVIEAVRDRLAKVTVGNPRHEDTRMGALVSLEQREEVRKAIQSLRASADAGLRRSRSRRRGRRRRRAWGVPLPRAAARPPRCGRAARRRAVRAGELGARLRRPRRGGRARGPRPRQPGGVPGHPRPRRRPHRGAGPGAVARTDPGPRPRRRR